MNAVARRVLLLLPGLIGAVRAAPQTPLVRVATGEWPPYASSRRADKGLALDRLRRALESRGYQVEFSFMFWPRTLSDTLTGRYDMAAYWADTPQRREHFLLSDPLVVERWRFVQRRDSSFDWQSLPDLQRYTLGLMKDYAYTPELWEAVTAGRQPRRTPSNDLAALRMVAAGLIDAFPLDESVACELAREQLSAPDQAALRFHPRPLMPRLPTHALLPRQAVRSAELLDAINAGLHDLAAQSIQEPHCPPGWHGDAIQRGLAP